MVDWRARLSGCFQDFARLEFTALQTVGVGDVPRVDDEAAVTGALERAHAADVPAGLPSGLGTQLGRTFDGGIEPSTGQWQKLALGRAMMREEPLLLVLDEPTASLDPQTEAALFERYAGAAARTARRTGAITVLVSHRFSTVRMADLIVVVSGGRIAEIGTHDQLVAAAGTRHAATRRSHATSPTTGRPSARSRSTAARRSGRPSSRSSRTSSTSATRTATTGRPRKPSRSSRSSS